MHRTYFSSLLLYSCTTISQYYHLHWLYAIKNQILLALFSNNYSYRYLTIYNYQILLNYETIITTKIYPQRHHICISKCQVNKSPIYISLIFSNYASKEGYSIFYQFTTYQSTTPRYQKCSFTVTHTTPKPGTYSCFIISKPLLYKL